MPKVGELMEEGTIVSWLITIGDRVNAGDAIGTIATDKVECEIETPFSGVVSALLAEPDQVLAVGEPICEIESGQ
jgi:pyruvate/2-oxoglutarate dehydrogenase complex dihydrolipoamide acyltransferase (E2) component